MMILGIGVDIIENKRIKKIIKKPSFIKRIFSQKEINYSKKISKKINYFSKRFAAKEAFVKSIGTGFRDKLNFKDIEILNDINGKPYYLINNKINKIIYKIFNCKKYEFLLSISDEKDYSIAFSILQKKK